MLTAKQQAPDFNTVNQKGDPVQLSDFKDQKNLVLYFYPKDDTPGCTIEANEFTALLPEFQALDTVVLGVSKDGCDSHQAFIDKFGLQIELLADTDGSLCNKYNVWQEKEKNGVRKMGIVRSTFIINKLGIIEKAEYQVDPNGHAQQVLDFIKQM